MWRIAVVHHGSPASPALARLREGLHWRGLIEGVHCIVDAVGVAGRLERLPQVIDELLQRVPDVIVALGAVAALSAQRATARVPVLYAIVLGATAIGLTAPNVTGISSFDPRQASRHLRLLRQLVPGLRRVAVLTDVESPRGDDGCNPLATRFKQAALACRIDATDVALSGVGANLDEAFDTVLQAGAQALVALEVPTLLRRLGEIGDLAERHRLPLLVPHGWADTGVVMEGTSLHDAINPLAGHVAALISGASVGDLPACTVRHQRLIFHLGRAQRLGLTVPASLVAQATHCIGDEPSDVAKAAHGHAAASATSSRSPQRDEHSHPRHLCG